MSDKQQEAMRRALEELRFQRARWYGDDYPKTLHEAINGLEAALAEPERQPMTEEEIGEATELMLMLHAGQTLRTYIRIAFRQAERHHGITKKETPRPVDTNSRCTQDLRAAGKAYPRTCAECGLGPCRRYPKETPHD